MTEKFPKEIVSQGGAGGSVEVGHGGYAIGGPGGHAGGLPGIGGDGGGLGGIGDIQAGGGGGSVDGPNIWFPPAVSGYEVYTRSIGERADPKMKPFGRGGMSQGYAARFEIVDNIRRDFLEKSTMTHRSIDEDIFAMPLEELNKTLEGAGLHWRARVNDYEQYVFYIP